MLLALILLAIALTVVALTFPDAAEAIVQRFSNGIGAGLASGAKWCRDRRQAMGRHALGLVDLGGAP